jgi:hypothetical protein
MKNSRLCLGIATLGLLLVAGVVVKTFHTNKLRAPATVQAATIPSTTAVEARADFARDVQKQLTQRGIHARVSLEGTDRDLLRIEWRELNRPFIYDFVTSPSLRSDARPVGLKSVIFANGGGLGDERFDYDVQRESMIWTPSPL